MSGHRPDSTMTDGAAATETVVAVVAAVAAVAVVVEVVAGEGIMEGTTTEMIGTTVGTTIGIIIGTTTETRIEDMTAMGGRGGVIRTVVPVLPL